MAESRASGHVLPNLALIKKLKEELGWSQERLALEANIGVRTAQKLFAGKPVRMRTLKAVAPKLGVSYSDLLGSVSAERPQKSKIRIIVEGDLAELNQHPLLMSFVGLLQQMVSTTADIQIVDVKSGSVAITLEMEPEDAHRLIDAFADFHEHARELLDAVPKTTDAEMEAYSKLRRLVEGVTELRVIAEPDPLVTENEAARDEHRPVPSQATVDRMNELRTIICRRMLDTYGVAAFSGGIPGMESAAKLLDELATLEHQYR